METREKDQIVYYYDRSKRLEKASPNARYIVESYGKKRPGLFKSMTATPALKFLFFTIVLMLLASAFITWVHGSSNSGTISGSKVSVKAMQFEGNVYITVTRTKSFFSSKSLALEIEAIVGENKAKTILQSMENECKISVASSENSNQANIVFSSAEGSEIKLSAKIE